MSRHSVVIRLLDLLVEAFLAVFQLQHLVRPRKLGGADLVSGLESRENRNAQAKTKILAEIVLDLVCERIAGMTAHRVVIGSQTTAGHKRWQTGPLCVPDGIFCGIQPELLRLD